MLPEDCSTNIVLTGTDVEGDALTFVTDGVLHGTLEDNGTNVVFMPEPNFNGEAGFLFWAFDGVSYSSYAAEVRILVTPVNDAPVSLPQSVTTAYNSPAAITLTGLDVEGAALGFTVLTAPSKGVLSGIAPNLTFTPSIGATGTTSFTFKATDGLLESAPATVSVTIQAPAAVPAAPSGLSATSASQSQITLAWMDASSNEDGFKIERSTNGSTWTQVGSVGPDVRSYASTGLTANKTYYFRVRAFNVLGSSAFSGTASAKTAK